ncbi:hypothetical protein PENTCL1PPCAC_28984 [Pristionchus entomophagus]|uniref:Uncharacterized protein n=1 Tax=Pristionchus entomophagus TaxID=358040 RepID=A0AAV5ULS8_9BILA|nr:hypothetical protein PENTCL1PPCAC_28984 [Pristionchus entomophagus]
MSVAIAEKTLILPSAEVVEELERNELRTKRIVRIGFITLAAIFIPLFIVGIFPLGSGDHAPFHLFH